MVNGGMIRSSRLRASCHKPKPEHEHDNGMSIA
jgi:hypothetical protein